MTLTLGAVTQKGLAVAADRAVTYTNYFDIGQRVSKPRVLTDGEKIFPLGNYAAVTTAANTNWFIKLASGIKQITIAEAIQSFDKVFNHRNCMRSLAEALWVQLRGLINLSDPKEVLKFLIIEDLKREGKKLEKMKIYSEPIEHIKYSYFDKTGKSHERTVDVNTCIPQFSLMVIGYDSYFNKTPRAEIWNIKYPKGFSCSYMEGEFGERLAWTGHISKEAIALKEKPRWDYIAPAIAARRLEQIIYRTEIDQDELVRSGKQPCPYVAGNPHSAIINNKGFRWIHHDN